MGVISMSGGSGTVTLDLAGCWEEGAVVGSRLGGVSVTLCPYEHVSVLPVLNMESRALRGRYDDNLREKE